jgi:S-adenosylmethionine decarboxylase
VLDESHRSVHAYADLGLLAIDVFTCGDADPTRLRDIVRKKLSVVDFTLHEVERFGAAEPLYP